MWILGVAVSLALIGLVLLDSFETTVLPRRVTHRFRLARLYDSNTWIAWRIVARAIPAGKLREAFLSGFGPLSMLGLLITWVVVLIFGFALFHWSAGTIMHTPDGQAGFWTYLYWSGGTF